MVGRFRTGAEVFEAQGIARSGFPATRAGAPAAPALLSFTDCRRRGRRERPGRRGRPALRPRGGRPRVRRGLEVAAEVRPLPVPHVVRHRLAASALLFGSKNRHMRHTCRSAPHPGHAAAREGGAAVRRAIRRSASRRSRGSWRISLHDYRSPGRPRAAHRPSRATFRKLPPPIGIGAAMTTGAKTIPGWRRAACRTYRRGDRGDATNASGPSGAAAGSKTSIGVRRGQERPSLSPPRDFAPPRRTVIPPPAASRSRPCRRGPTAPDPTRP